MEEPERAPRDLLMAVVTKIAAEVAAGTMGPRRALEELVVLHPPKNKSIDALTTTQLVVSTMQPVACRRSL